ncbi:hypothetical protein DFH11DRAFT_1566159 [Phellopilus nigrolimitatus]|nr:hypothetical protein DFH11DRAFT_1566159 [Phellopilus nigrolimitatus]
MVRLNSGLSSRNDSSGDGNEGRGLSALLTPKVTFWGMVGATMAALKIKERWDGQYRTVPSKPDANPLAPPSYRDDDCDTESAIGLDTSLSMPKRTKRKRNFCICCGINCSLFCKALGVVLLIFTIWNGIKLAKWALTPSPTGIEGMPEFSNSLGCLDATHFFQDSTEGTFYTVAVGEDADHSIVVEGGAVGTLVLAPSTAVDEEVVKIRASVRTNEASLLDNIVVHTPDSGTQAPIGTAGTSYFALSSPADAKSAGACLRYDLTVYVPPNLRTLRITARAVAQVKYDFGGSPRELHTLHIALAAPSPLNLLLPTGGLAADNTEIVVHGGYVVGTLPVANSTAVDTRAPGDAVARLALATTAYRIPDAGAVAHVRTVTGAGRADFTVENAAGRRVWGEHVSRGLAGSELRLTYKDARFNGKVELDARSYSMRNVQSDVKAGERNGERWVGDKEGGDFLRVTSTGWVGLYF